MSLCKTFLASMLATILAAPALAHDAVTDLGVQHPSGEEVPQVDVLGATELVFNAVEPCRLLDTRVASARGGRLPAQGERDFLVFDADFALEQGGNEGGCGLPDTIRAVAINLTAVDASGRGFVTAWDYGTARPGTATLNLIPGEDVNNQLTVAINANPEVPDLMVYSFASTHLVADIVGYYTRRPARALECATMSSGNIAVAANTNASTTAPSCSAGYSRTGGTCVGGSFETYLVSSLGIGGTHFCAYRNTGASESYIRAEVTCCRIPNG